MKRIITGALFVMIMMLTTFSLVQNARADEMKMVGAITKIELAADGKSAIAVLKDSKTGDNVTITITDDLTLDKFKDKRIVEGDEIRTKYDKEGDKNHSKLFRKTAGC